MKKQEPHKHNHTKLGYTREVGLAEHSNALVPSPLGRQIDRIILYRECDCGDRTAFECGDKDKMRVLYAKLTRMEDKKDANGIKPDHKRITGQKNTQVPKT